MCRLCNVQGLSPARPTGFQQFCGMAEDRRLEAKVEQLLQEVSRLQAQVETLAPPPPLQGEATISSSNNPLA
eukprot:SAG31_NODE_30232_length_384_cov_0.364912_1_plen_71_part_01